MKKVMKTLALVMAIVMAVTTPAMTSEAGFLGDLFKALVKSTYEEAPVVKGAVVVGTVDGTEDGTDDGTDDGKEDLGTVDGTDDGNDGTNDGDDQGTGDGADEGIPADQVLAIAFDCGNTMDVEVGMGGIVSAVVITNTGYDYGKIEWSVDGTAVKGAEHSEWNDWFVYEAVEGGTATVTATAGNKSASLTFNVKEYATDMKFAQDSYVSYLKHKVDMSAELVKTPATANDDVFYSVNNKKVATVDKNGVVTMKKVGTVELTAATEHGVVAKTTIEVKEGNPVKKITLNTKKVTLDDYLDAEVIEAKIETKYDGVTTDELVWSENKKGKVVSITQEGNKTTVTAIGVGKAKVTVKATSGKKASANVTAKAVLKSINIVEEAGVAYPKQKVTINVAKDPSVATDKVKYATSDKKVATVKAGKNNTAVITVKAKKVEEPTTVTITAYVGKKLDSATAKDTYTLTVNPSTVSSLTAVEGKAQLSVGEVAQYVANTDATADQITWSSSSAKVLTIDENGVATALKAGTAKVKATVTLATGKTVSKTLKVKVVDQATALSFKKPMVAVIAGKKKAVTFKAVTTPKKAVGTIEYSVWVYDAEGKEVTNSGITINNKGKVSIPKNATKAGDVICVTAMVKETGVSAYGQINVVSEKAKVTFNNGNIVNKKVTIEQGSALDLETVTSNGEWPTYTVNKKGIVTVDDAGLVYGVMPGKVKVTAKTLSGGKAAVTITVVAPTAEEEVGTEDGTNDGTTDGTTDGK